MSTLVLDELFSGVVFSQTIRISEDVAISHVRPWIYKQGTLADGDFTCRVKDGSEVLKEVSINYTLINAAIPESFAHGFIRFDLDHIALQLPDKAETYDYIIEFEMVNHTTDVSNFIGINRSWENKIYETITEAPNDMVEPAGIEIYEFKEKL